MSAAAVREAFRDKIAGLLASEGYAFFESVNLASSTKDLPSRWYTLDFVPSDDARMSLGSPALFRESGLVTVAVYSEHNVEDADAVAAAEIIRAQMCNWFDASGHIRVTEAQPPADLDGGDFRGAFYGITVDLRYNYDRFA
jgi:hypothetical protein